VNSELSDSIRAITQDKGISSELVQKVVEEFLLAAYKKTYGTSDNAVVKFGEDLGEVTISAKKVVVEDDDLFDSVGEIELKRAGGRMLYCCFGRLLPRGSIVAMRTSWTLAWSTRSPSTARMFRSR